MFKTQRDKIDRNYFPEYNAERQAWQDAFIKKLINSELEEPRKKIAIFTCGPYGAGKGHVLRALGETALVIDPDAIRYKLPEAKTMDPDELVAKTHMESTYISLLTEHIAIDLGMRYIVDGSLRNHEWYSKHFAYLRTLGYFIIIYKVNTDFRECVTRAERRAITTGRHIARDVLKKAYDDSNNAFEILKHKADQYIVFDNNDEIPVVTKIGYVS